MNAPVITDPVVAQVIRGRLVAITDQMRLALQAVSGSPTVTEASDFFTGLYLPDGTFATMGHQVTFEAPPVGSLIRHLLDSGTELKDGDRIIGNDPFIGALHQNDVQMCAPLLVDGELIAWAGVMAHETDMGGMDFSSWSPKAREVWQEGIRIPAVKLVDGGTLRQDVLDMILAATRLPAQVGLDIRAFIATLNVAAERLKELSTQYGTAAVQAVMNAMVDDAHTRMRQRLLEIPDGIVRVCDFLEHDGHNDVLYTVDLVATKRGDALTFDFSGSSPQAPGFVNCSRAGLMGGVAGAVIPTLGFGLPWNEGLLRPVTVTAPDALVCTAVPPAPVGSATVETIWVVSNVVAGALNRLLAASPRYAARAQAISSGTMATFNLSGRDHYGHFFGLHLMDPIAGGFGAFAAHDGPNAAGPLSTPCPSIADVESNEQKSPLFYLHRRLARDSGGAGRRRGGLGAEVALSVTIDTAEALVMTHGLEVPNSTGLGGGCPGGLVSQALGQRHLADPADTAGRATSVHPLSDQEVAGFTGLGPKPGAFTLTNTDVFAVTWQGGGGIGDPLDRDPHEVATDVRLDMVSPVTAHDIYGVVVHGHGAGMIVDEDATRELRRDIRAVRLGKNSGDVPLTTAPIDPTSQPVGCIDADQWIALSDRLRLVRSATGEWRVQTVDGAVLVTGCTRWREGAKRVVPTLPAVVIKTLHPDLATTGWVCPHTGHLLAVDIHRRDQEPSHDLDLDLTPGSTTHALIATTTGVGNDA
ncbi:hydantoinase B/oxoprolinase family protein [Mycobacterium lentiflavum]|uniref:Hydantoinase B/oxoprolinase family protein n=1 Tax=Mycobacterium lentiflavum TaxID=141349 RepID=A0ABY3USA6_MYCLN|nr:hydantoinase B/oxoprolinase family protein [Mycobacterium lentiflavum]ULP41602.1 hydantoinase B/oxoprolinase family protein [Mycobacterium lentiflavum]